MDADTQLLVIGAGPAGSAAARRARALGLSVMLLDRAELPRDKLCGGLVTGRSASALQEVFGLGITPDLFLTSRHMRFRAGARVLADKPAAPPMHLTLRRPFDARLHGLAVAAGAVAETGALDRIEGRCAVLKDGRRIGFEVLIGADGANSAVARALFGRAYDPATIGFGLEIEAPRPPDDDDTVEVDFDAARWGYGWSFPKHGSRTVGVGGVKARTGDLKDAMAAYRDMAAPQAGAARVKGAFLPFGDFRTVPGQGRILLAGDAAGLVDPITGEGIALALESGALAAEAAADALRTGTPDRALARYRTALRPIHAELRQARLWRWLLFPQAMRPVFLKSFATSSMPDRYLRLLAGEIRYGDLRSDLIRKTPRALWRALRT
jgi:geranylgeranyl reductase family protein